MIINNQKLKKMKKLQCEMCGSTDMVKQNGVFVCQSCGLKYSVEDAKKLMIDGVVEVKGAVMVDKTSEIDNLYILASREVDLTGRYINKASIKEERWKKIMVYYRKIVEIDANNIPACLYVAFDNFKTSQKDLSCYAHEFRQDFLDQLSPLPVESCTEEQILVFSKEIEAWIDSKMPPKINECFRAYIEAVYNKYSILLNFFEYYFCKSKTLGSSSLKIENISDRQRKMLCSCLESNVRWVCSSVYYDSYFLSDDYIKKEYEKYLLEMEDEDPDDLDDISDYEMYYGFSDIFTFIDKIRHVINEELSKENRYYKPIEPLSDSEKIDRINDYFDEAEDEGFNKWELKDEFHDVMLLLNVAKRIDRNYSHPFVEKITHEVEEIRKQEEEKQKQEEEKQKQEEENIKSAQKLRRFEKIYGTIFCVGGIVGITVIFFVKDIPFKGIGLWSYIAVVLISAFCCWKIYRG